MSQPIHPALADSPGHLMWRAAARVSAATEEEQRAGVDPHAVAALRVLTERVAGGATRGAGGAASDAAAPEPCSQQELADTVGISRTTMTRVAAALVEQGLVERVRNPHDRRSYALTPTDAGAHAVRVWGERAEPVQEALVATFTAQERRDLAGLLRLVAQDEAADGPDAPRAEDIGFLIGRAHTRLHRHALAALAPLDLEPRLFGTLTVLAATGPVAQAEVARLLGLSGASIVQIADDLEERGLVERRRDPADRRTQLLHLSAQAPARIEAARTVAVSTMSGLLAALSPDEVDRLVALLLRFVTTP